MHQVYSFDLHDLLYQHLAVSEPTAKDRYADWFSLGYWWNVQPLPFLLYHFFCSTFSFLFFPSYDLCLSWTMSFLWLGFFVPLCGFLWAGSFAFSLFLSWTSCLSGPMVIDQSDGQPTSHGSVQAVDICVPAPVTSPPPPPPPSIPSLLVSPFLYSLHYKYM